MSYSGDFAAELHRQFRQVASSEWYAALFPRTRWAKETGLEFVTTLGGGRYATSVGGTLTGRGADLIIIDDPLNANEAQSEAARKRVIDWSAARSSLASMTSAPGQSSWSCSDCTRTTSLAMLCAREDGRISIFRRSRSKSGRSARTRKVASRQVGEALHPARESTQALEAVKREIGSMMFSAQYQQRPVPLEGNLIRRAWFRWFTPSTLPPPTYPTKIVQSWDVAMQTGERTTTRSARPGGPIETTFTCSTFSAVGSNIPSCGAR